MAMYDKFKPTDGQVEQKKIYHTGLEVIFLVHLQSFASKIFFR